MKRNRSQYRSARERAIRRKEKFLLAYGGDYYLQAWTRGCRGRLAKGKIHCSCWMCRTKSYDMLSHSDRRKLDRAQAQMDEFS